MPLSRSVMYCREYIAQVWQMLHAAHLLRNANCMNLRTAKILHDTPA
jgi:hypothetical protein